MDPATTPVIVAVGEHVDRPQSPEQAREPVDLMAAALRGCEADAGASLLGAVTSLDLIGLISWPYCDPVRLLAERLGIAPAEARNASMGGETPVRLIHEAARRIAAGDPVVAAIVGGEASHAVAQAQKLGLALPWTPPAPRDAAVRFPSSRFALSPVARALGMASPTSIYPFYEVATQARWGETPAEGRAADAALWARFAAVAAENPAAWLRRAPDAGEIARVDAANRMIAWPYPKLMVANPMVNQAAAIVVASLATARSLGVAEDRLVHIWGGGHAVEPEDYLHRDRYDRATAQDAVLARAVALAGGVDRLAHLELYSCFPVVPRMALRALGIAEAHAAPTVAGGLTFFGGPLNNYMSHATAAMVRRVRAAPGTLGLLYGQGGYVNKHQSLVVGTAPPPAGASVLDWDVQRAADAARDPVPPLVDAHDGPATIETHTVLYARDGSPAMGVVIARTPAGARLMARVPADDAATIARLTDWDRSAVGSTGRVATDADGAPVFAAG